MQIFLIHCSENSDVAANITTNLERMGIRVIPDNRSLTTRNSDDNHIKTSHFPILLLISDNYLKNKDCMYQSLKLFKEDTIKNRITSIITDGKKIEKNGKIQYTPTKFERVGDVIHYMNHWQSKYLELRKTNRSKDISNVSNTSSELNIVQSISSDIGDFFRILRGLDYQEFSDAHKSKFVHTLKKANWTSVINQLSTIHFAPYEPEKSTTPLVENTAIEIPNTSSSNGTHVAPTTQPIQVNPPKKNKEELSLLEKVVEHRKQAEKAKNQESTPPKENTPSTKDQSSYELLVALFENDEIENETTESQHNTLEENKEKFSEEFPKENRPLQLVPKIKIPATSIPNQETKIEKLPPVEIENTGNHSLEKQTNEEFETISDEEIIQGKNDLEPEDDKDLEELVDEIMKKNNEPNVPTPALDTVHKSIEEGDLLIATEMLQTIIAKEPENVAARYDYGMLLMDKLHNYKEAKEQFLTLLSIDKTSVETNLRLAELYELEENNLTAKRFYEQALEINPKYPGLHYKLALLLHTKLEGTERIAIRHLKKATQQDPQNTDAIYLYAVMLNENLKKPKKALKQFRKVLEIEPNHTFANYDMALLYHDLYKPKHAAKYYKAAYKNNPEFRTEENDAAFKVDTYLKKKKNPKGKISILPKEEIIDEIAFDTIEEIDEVYIITPDSHLLEEDPYSEWTRNQGLHLEETITQDSVLAFDENGNKITMGESLVTIEEETSTDREIIELGIDTHGKEKEEVASNTSNLALITGATSGIGKATARQFAVEGHDLIITGRRADRLKSIQQELIKEYNVQVEILEFDIRSLNACRKAMDSLDERFKNVGILVNNAGLAKGKQPIFEGNIDHWETMIDTNIKGLLYMTHLVAPGMIARGKGHIINVGSIAGKEVYPNGNVYCATKHAVDALTKAMRMDMHKYNIRVSAIHPGAVEETEFSLVRHDFDKEKALDYQAYTPVNARDIAEVIHFIATRPDHVNIQDVLVTGTQQATATITDNSGRKD